MKCKFLNGFDLVEYLFVCKLDDISDSFLLILFDFLNKFFLCKLNVCMNSRWCIIIERKYIMVGIRNIIRIFKFG